MLPATSVLILQQYPRQYWRPCRRCISSIWEPGLRVYAGLSLCSRKQWCGTVCTGLLMQHLSVPPHQCGGGGVSINERWLYLQATQCAQVRPPEQNAPLLTVADPGEGPSPPLFSDQTEALRAEKIFLWSPRLPLSQGLDPALAYMAKIAHWD